MPLRQCDGSWNVNKEGEWQCLIQVRDVFHTAIDMPFWNMTLCVWILYTFVILFFALLYFWVGNWGGKVQCHMGESENNAIFGHYLRAMYFR